MAVCNQVKTRDRLERCRFQCRGVALKFVDTFHFVLHRTTDTTLIMEAVRSSERLEHVTTQTVDTHIAFKITDFSHGFFTRIYHKNKSTRQKSSVQRAVLCFLYKKYHYVKKSCTRGTSPSRQYNSGELCTGPTACATSWCASRGMRWMQQAHNRDAIRTARHRWAEL